MIRRFARPYAKALLDSAETVEAAAETRRSLGAFALAMERVPALPQMAGNPGVPMEVKHKIIAEVGDQLQIDTLARRFLEILVSNYRLVHLDGILEAIDALLNRRLGIVTAKISTAERMEDTQRERLRSVLESTFGHKVNLKVSVDSELLAGFVALVESDRYDGSLRSQLDRMAVELASATLDG